MLDGAEVDRWREDLRFLAREMPRRHRNLFHTLTRREFDDAVARLDERIPSLARHQVVVEIARLAARVGDGHTGVRGFFYGPQVGFRYYPVALYLFEDGLFVYAADPRYADLVGGRLVGIGDASVEEAIAAVAPLVSRDNDMSIRERAPLHLTAPEVLHAVGLIDDPERARFVVEKGGERRSFELRPVDGPRPQDDNWALGQRFSRLPGWIDARDGSRRPTPSWLKSPEDYFWFEYLEASRTVYVQYNDCANKEDESVAEFAERLFAFVEANPVDRFVLDLRWNTGGNNQLNKPLLLGILKSAKIDRRGKLFTIIGRRTFSAAQNLVNDLESYTRAIFVGEPTAGNPNFYGDPTGIVLPNSGIAVGVSTLWWQDLDPRDAREWTGPRLAVGLGFEDFRAGTDPALEAILAHVPGPELGETLAEALAAGGVEPAVEAYRRFKADPANAYLDTERPLNALGYRLLESKQPERAIAIFRLNVETYPRSANAHDSLAEAYMAYGDRALAIEHYEASLALDPANSNAVSMLSRLRAEP